MRITTTASKTAGQLDCQEKEVKTILLDTSVQIQRMKAKKHRDPIEAFLQQYHFKATSSYAKLEFKRSWCKDLAFIYTKCKNAQSEADVIDQINASFGADPRTRRRLSRCLEILVAALQYVDDAHPRGQSRLRLRRLRQYTKRVILDSYPAWDRSVTHEYNGLECSLAEQPPRSNNKGHMDVYIRRHCRPEDCDIAQFFTTHVDDFRQIASRIRELQRTGENVSRELEQTADQIERAIKSPQHLCDHAQCKKMGDALIAVDGLAMETFGANNPAEWNCIAHALGRELVNPVKAE